MRTCPVLVLLRNQTWVHLSIGPSAIKPVYQHEVVVGKVQQLLYAPSKVSRQLMPKPPTGFQKVFKDTVSEGGCGVQDQLVDILLICWWWGNQRSASSTFWFRPVWGLPANEQHAVNFFHLVGVSLSVKKKKSSRMYLRILSIALKRN